MNETEAIEISRQAIWVMLKLGGPVMLAALLVGVVVSLVQAITQIQEATLTYVPKMLVVFLLGLWLLPFMMASLGGFTETLAARIVQMGSGAG